MYICIYCLYSIFSPVNLSRECMRKAFQTLSSCPRAWGQGYHGDVAGSEWHLLQCLPRLRGRRHLGPLLDLHKPTS